MFVADDVRIAALRLSKCMDHIWRSMVANDRAPHIRAQGYGTHGTFANNANTV